MTMNPNKFNRAITKLYCQAVTKWELEFPYLDEKLVV